MTHMKKTFILLPFFISGCTMAYYEPINATVGQKKQAQVTWEIVEDPTKICKEKHNVQTPGMTPLLACTAWQGSKCTIYTDTHPSYELLGHELRHCFDHNWHD